MKKIFLLLFAVTSFCFSVSTARYWVMNTSMVNNVSSPVLRSAVVSPIAAGAGHVAGGTTAGLLQGQSLDEAFANSFEGIGKSMAIGLGIGVTTTIAVSYVNGINPWTGEKTLYRAVSEVEYIDMQNNGLRPNPDGSGYQYEKLFYKSSQDAIQNTKAYDAAYGQQSIIVKINGPNMPIYNNGYIMLFG